MNAAEVQSLIEAGLPGAQVRVSSPDDTHFEAVIVVSSAFEGVSRVRKQQLVYAAISELIRDGALHAVTIHAHTPAERGDA